MTIRLHHIPEGEIPELRKAYEKGNWSLLIETWNECQVTTTRLCDCLDGVITVQNEMPRLWSAKD